MMTPEELRLEEERKKCEEADEERRKIEQTANDSTIVLMASIIAAF